MFCNNFDTNLTKIFLRFLSKMDQNSKQDQSIPTTDQPLISKLNETQVQIEDVSF